MKWNKTLFQFSKALTLTWKLHLSRSLITSTWPWIFASFILCNLSVAFVIGINPSSLKCFPLAYRTPMSTSFLSALQISVSFISSFLYPRLLNIDEPQILASRCFLPLWLILSNFIVLNNIYSTCWWSVKFFLDLDLSQNFQTVHSAESSSVWIVDTMPQKC